MYICSPLQTVEHPLFAHHHVTVQIKRDDLIHPIISGNKWRKLKYNLTFAQQHNKKGILSFGGAYSNHIHALAFACKHNNLASKAIIRGEASYQNNATLSAAKSWGMELEFVDRATYRQRYDTEYLKYLQSQHENFYIVPEGGSNSLALQGVGEIITELAEQTEFDTLMVPVGSSGTLSGLIQADDNQHNILGIAVLKGGQYLEDSIGQLLDQESSGLKLKQKHTRWQLLTNFHRGGYAKFSREDEQRILDFSLQTKLPFEPVYSGKMILALLDLLEQGYFPIGHRILLVHTGGLQGLAGLNEQKRLKLAGWQVPSIF